MTEVSYTLLTIYKDYSHKRNEQVFEKIMKNIRTCIDVELSKSLLSLFSIPLHRFIVSLVTPFFRTFF